MEPFFPFIFEIEKKKKDELQPLYIELIPPPQEQEEKKDDESPGIIIIEL